MRRHGLAREIHSWASGVPGAGQHPFCCTPYLDSACPLHTLNMTLNDYYQLNQTHNHQYCDWTWNIVCVSLEKQSKVL